jgi:ATPase complex subunit ATP10
VPPPPEATEDKPRAPAPSQQIHRPSSKVPTTPGGHWKHPGYIEPLGRPIGSAQPPDIHDNSPIDTRDFREKYKDFTNVERHLAKREKLKSALARPYFRDWKNLKFEKGKLWLGNEKLWRGEMSLWMPNLVGETLSGEPYRATTEVLRGKISLVAVFQRDWAQKQAETWFGASKNPVVAKLIEEGRVQLVQVNVEDAPLARVIQNMFRWFMRRGVDKKRQDGYFFVRQIPDSVVEEIGILNSRVGYVYLVDQECKIRWAGCADANEGEKEALNKGAETLVRRAEMGGKTSPR